MAWEKSRDFGPDTEATNLLSTCLKCARTKQVGYCPNCTGVMLYDAIDVWCVDCGHELKEWKCECGCVNPYNRTFSDKEERSVQKKAWGVFRFGFFNGCLILILKLIAWFIFFLFGVPILWDLIF